jgi:hypothetical protein
MRAFRFRLEQALRWRENQVNLQKSNVAGAAGQLAQIEARLEKQRSELTSATALLIEEPTGAVLESYAGYKEASRARIRDSEAQVLAAQRTLALERSRLVGADQKLRMLENLKCTGSGLWRKEFDRELAVFADEAFLGKIQSENRRARSSGG